MSGRQAPQQAVPGAAESFLLLDENAFAHAAVMQLLRRKSPHACRLVCLYGPSGVGKSHLVRMFLRERRAAAGRQPVAHFTASDFAAEFAEASDEKQIHQFQRTSRDAHVLVCEDLGSLENKYETRQQFVSLLDAVLARGGECLLTSRLAPGEMPGLGARLINRCHGGVCAAMELPAQASRVRLLTHFSQSRLAPMSPAAAQLLAAELPVTPRELLATVIQLDAQSRPQGGIIDEAAARRYLHGEVKPRKLGLPKIAGAVARHFGVRLSELRESSRARDQVLPRQYGMLLARELTTESLETIADYFGRRNHSTVLHACQRIEELMANSPELRRHLAQIRADLGLSGGAKRRKRVEKCSTNAAQSG